MSTQGIITVRVKDADKGIRRINPGLFYFNGEECSKYRELCPDINLTKNYISITCNSDSYPSGLGVTLIRAYMDYNMILNVCLGGNISCLDVYPEHYVLWDRTFQYNEPKITDHIPSCTQDWQYLFEDGKWFARKKDTDFMKVEEWLHRL